MEDKDLKLEKNIVLSSVVESGPSKICNSKLSQLSNRLLVDNINKECERRFEAYIQEPPGYDDLCKNIKELLQKEAPPEIRDDIEVFVNTENVEIDLGEVSFKIAVTNNTFTEEALKYLKYIRSIFQEEKQDGKQLLRIFQKHARRRKQLKKYHIKKGIR